MRICSHPATGIQRKFMSTEDGGIGDEKIIAILYSAPIYMDYTMRMNYLSISFQYIALGESTGVNDIGGQTEAIKIIEEAIGNYDRKLAENKSYRGMGI